MAKSYRIEWAPIASQDLDETLEYISVQSGVDRAIALYSTIQAKVNRLSAFPTRCRVVPELRAIGVMEYRELIVPPYRVFFRISGAVVGTVGVLDGRRDLGEILIRRALADA